MTNCAINKDISYEFGSNILLYGDSIMKGVVYDNTKNKYTRLSNSFANTIKSKLNATITNTATFGNTVGRALKKFYSDITKKKPDIVILEFGGNDCDFNWKEIANDPDAKHLPKTQLNEFIGIYHRMISDLIENNIIPVMLSIPPIDSKRYFDWISENNPIAAANILKWLGRVDKIYEWQEMYNNAILNIATSTSTLLIDIRKEFIEKDDFSKYLCIDGIHPNEEGHKLIASRIESFLQSTCPQLLKQ